MIATLPQSTSLCVNARSSASETGCSSLGAAAAGRLNLRMARALATEGYEASSPVPERVKLASSSRSSALIFRRSGSVPGKEEVPRRSGV